MGVKEAAAAVEPWQAAGTEAVGPCRPHIGLCVWRGCIYRPIRL